MSHSARRVIGIIRISQSRDVGADWNAGCDDGSLGAVLAGLVGKRIADCSRWRPAAPAAFCGRRRVVPANLTTLREQLEREYVALTAG